MQELQLWLRHLSQPEYIHVLLNPLPIYGTAIGALALLLALIFRSRPAQVVALILIMLSCASAWLVAEYGEKSYDRVKAISSAEARAWLELHEDRAEDLVWFFYGTTALAGLAIGVPSKFQRARALLTAATLALALAATLAGGWIAHAGGQIRHSEFRDGPPS